MQEEPDRKWRAQCSSNNSDSVTFVYRKGFGMIPISHAIHNGSYPCSDVIVSETSVDGETVEEIIIQPKSGLSSCERDDDGQSNQTSSQYIEVLCVADNGWQTKDKYLFYLDFNPFEPCCT